LAFSKKIDAATAVASEGELKEFVSEIDKMAGDMSSEDAEKFLGALSGIDWTVSE
jgi:hypothetical protein